MLSHCIVTNKNVNNIAIIYMSSHNGCDHIDFTIIFKYNGCDHIDFTIVHVFKIQLHAWWCLLIV